MRETIIWSRDQCVYCDQAKHFMRVSGIKFEERNISTEEWTREQLLEAVPDAKTVPQIFLNGVHVGGYTELLKYCEDHNIPNGNQGII